MHQSTTEQNETHIIIDILPTKYHVGEEGNMTHLFLSVRAKIMTWSDNDHPSSRSKQILMFQLHHIGSSPWACSKIMFHFWPFWGVSTFSPTMLHKMWLHTISFIFPIIFSISELGKKTANKSGYVVWNKSPSNWVAFFVATLMWLHTLTYLNPRLLPDGKKLRYHSNCFENWNMSASSSSCIFVATYVSSCYFCGYKMSHF